MARYTIEDNSEDKIIFDEYRFNDISVIKTVFRNLIGKYEILPAKDELKIHEDVSDVICWTVFIQKLKLIIKRFSQSSLRD